MKRTCSPKPSLLGHYKDIRKKTMTSKASRQGKLSTLSVKKTDYYRPTYRTNRHLTRSPLKSYGTNINKTRQTPPLSSQQEGVDLTLLSALRHEAYDELHRQMQQYNDSFVFEMQKVELQQRNSTLTTVDEPLSTPQRRRSSLHHRPRRPSSCYHSYQQKEENEPIIEELANLLETGTIKDYSLLTEWELDQNPQMNFDEEQGGLGDMW